VKCHFELNFLVFDFVPNLSAKGLSDLQLLISGEMSSAS
jgi:hypothetical protein